MAKRQQSDLGLARLSNFACFGKASTTCFHCNYHLLSAATYRSSKGWPVCSFQQGDTSQPAPARLPGSLAGTAPAFSSAKFSPESTFICSPSARHHSPAITVPHFHDLFQQPQQGPLYCSFWLSVNNLPRV